MKTLLENDCTAKASGKTFLKKASVKTFLNDKTLPLFKNNSLELKHERFFKKIIQKKN